MAHYAMVVVVKADDVNEAHAFVTAEFQGGTNVSVAEFVGDPWEVEPIDTTISTPVADYHHEFDTSNCIDQRR